MGHSKCDSFALRAPGEERAALWRDSPCVPMVWGSVLGYGLSSWSPQLTPPTTPRWSVPPLL